MVIFEGKEVEAVPSQRYWIHHNYVGRTVQREGRGEDADEFVDGRVDKGRRALEKATTTDVYVRRRSSSTTVPQYQVAKPGEAHDAFDWRSKYMLSEAFNRKLLWCEEYDWGSF